ncbi:hypothetical protein AB1283_00685 [Bacillus sp. S13(2024)]|uniref:hypothetical protein n=1 Tax=Bacillus sp. S13(2024) TaxID=3162885 RepID=UPI003D19E906
MFAQKVSTKVINNKAVQFIDEDTNLEITDCHIDCVEVIKENQKSMNRKVIVNFYNNGKGAERILHKDDYGYFIKHNGVFESVKEIDGEFFVVPTPADIHNKRNNWS